MMENTYNTPKVQDFQIEGVMHIGAYDAYSAMLEGEVLLLDVREAHEKQKGLFGDHENIIYHPMSRIMATINKIPKDQPIVVCCVDGVRSTKVANLLRIQEFPSVANLDGGLDAWQAAGMPVTGGQSSHECYSCGCGCGG
jgi:rhodanese-related sulfurtransferase